MTLTAKDVAEITRLLEASNFDELYLELDGLKLSLRRGAAGNLPPLGQGPTQPAQPQSTQPQSTTPQYTPPPATTYVPPNAAAAQATSPLLQRAAAAAPGPSPASAPPPGQPPSPASAPSPGQPPPPAHASPADPNAVDVVAPLLGTFYRAPKPGAPPFVEVGSPVEPDTIIGIIEVMKLMNTVRAGVHGKVTQILGRDGALVEYGESLMRVGR